MQLRRKLNKMMKIIKTQNKKYKKHLIILKCRMQNKPLSNRKLNKKKKDDKKMWIKYLINLNNTQQK